MFLLCKTKERHEKRRFVSKECPGGEIAWTLSGGKVESGGGAGSGVLEKWTRGGNGSNGLFREYKEICGMAKRGKN